MLTKAELKPIVTVSVITALTLLGDSLLYSILPLYAGSLGISTFMVGLILSMNRWVRLATNSLAARSFARWDIAVIMAAVVLATAACTAAYAFPLGVAIFLTARIMWGACYSHFRLGAYLLALRTNPAGLGLALGIVQSVSRLGSMAAVVGGGLLADRAGYSAAMAAAALLSLAALPFVFGLWRPQSRPDTPSESGAAVEAPVEEPLGDTFSLAFCNRAGFVTYLVGWGIVMASMAAVLQERAGSGTVLAGHFIGIATLSGFASSTNWLSTLVVSPLAGRLSDRWGRRRPFLVATLLQGGSLMLVAFSQNILATMISFAVFFVCMNAQRVFLDAAAGDGARQQGSAAISRYSSWQDLGSAVGPLIGYGLAGLASFQWVYTFGAALLIGIGLISLADRREEGRVWSAA